MASGDTVFSFGKHRGRSFQDVANSDPGYCEWASKIESPSGAMKDFVEFFRQRRSSLGGGGSPQPAARPHGVPVRHPQGGSGGVTGAIGRPMPKVSGVRLPPDVMLVCELVGEDCFVVRAEAAPAAAGGSPGGRHLPPQIGAALAALPGAKLAGDGRGYLYPLVAYDSLRHSLETLGHVDRIPPWVLGLVRSKQSQDVEPLCEENVPTEMMPYQLEGLKFGLSRGGRCLIGDEMGLGKTLQALAIAAQYTQDWPMLVVCPSSLCWVWKEQALQWLPDLLRPDHVQVIRKGSDRMNPSAKMYIISYNLLGLGAKKGNFHSRPDGSAHSVVICDESHYLKEWKSARTKAVVPLLQKATRVMLLSGTPTRNSADELHPQLCGLIPGMPAKYAEFRARYCLQQSSSIGMGRVVSKIVGVRNAVELNYLLTSTVMVRRLKKEVLTQLPDKRRQRIPVEVPAKLLDDISGVVQVRAGDYFTEVDKESAPATFMKMANAKLPAVKEYLAEVLERANEKMIVFAHHKHFMDELSALFGDRLGKDGLHHVRIDGSTPHAKRFDLVKCFQEDESCRIALLSITACGEGLSMTAAGLVIFAELYWVPGAVEQAEARAHRLGSTHTKVIVEFLVVPNSPDEQIYRSLERKKKDTSHVLNGAVESWNATHKTVQKSQRGKRAADDDSAAAPAKRPASMQGDVTSTPSPSGSKKRPTSPPAAAAPSFVSRAHAEKEAVKSVARASSASCSTTTDKSTIDFLLRAAREGKAEYAIASEA